MLTLGWFSTGRGEGSRGLLSCTMEAIQRGELDARIGYVFCNRAPGEHEGSDQFMALVRRYGIPLVTFSSRAFRKERGAPVAKLRAEHDLEIMRRIAPYRVDLCVLAGYMLIVSGELCRAYTMLNLHPALPGGPTGTWQEVIWKLIEQRASETGAMVHLVTEDLDQGPAVTYASFHIRNGVNEHLWQQAAGRSTDELKATEGEELQLFKAIRVEGMRRERPLLLESLIAFAQGRASVEGRKVVDAQGAPIKPLCLNPEVERGMAATWM
ncbi:MAG: hypothetical protein EXR48_03530 [Dehalococcoidia bacterium]|nr:hypothetical protein [Dehalococcoidia bacterium]